MSALLSFCLTILLLLVAACRTGPERAPVIGEAYVGAATLNLRKDIPLQSPVVATVKFGERLEIIQHRRRFLRVRTQRGIEGWTDERLLLSGEEIHRIQQRSQDARGLPSQGLASTYETLNVHTEPDRLAPSFLQVKEGEKVDVLAHRVTPRIGQPRKPLLPPPVRKAPVAKRKKESKYPPPPMPAPPPAPANWLDLSKTPPEVAAEMPKKETPPMPTDDWSLIRTSAGQTGWVLTRRLYLAIPDEVAQYAEGHRITSYFSLGDVQDGDTVKHNWLWTTIGQSLQPYDFDSFRVFIWSLRRHRYETAYIERNLTGYFPVLLHPVDLASTARGKSVRTTYPGFSMCVEKSDGVRYRRSYAFISNIVRFAGQKPCEAAGAEEPSPAASGLVAAAGNQQARPKNFWDQVKERLGAMRKRWFGR